MATWNNITKSANVIPLGSPIGLLLSLTYAQEISGSTWNNVSRSSGSWNNLNRSLGSVYGVAVYGQSNYGETYEDNWTNVNKS